MAPSRSAASRPAASRSAASRSAASGSVPSDPDGAQVVLVHGDEELLVARAIASRVAAARAADPDIEVREFPASAVTAGELLDACSPTLFGGGRVTIVRKAEELPADRLDTVRALLRDPAPEVVLILQHSGGARGKALVEAAREAGAAVVPCAPLTRAEERLEFVRNEVRAASGSISPDAAAALLDAVGSDLRELAAVSAQLVADCGGAITVAAVAAYHRGRAEVTGFAVSDRAVVGDVAGALETLRWAMAIGVPPVLIADALADGIRSVARVAAGGRGSDYELASRLGMPPWKVKRARSQARQWSEPGLIQAMAVTAQVNAAVKGVSADAGYALERAIQDLAAARAQRA